MWVSGIALCMVGNMSRGSFNCQRVGVLLSAGSFSPPTLMHLLSLEQSREYVENTLHHPVWKGFLSPVHDACLTLVRVFSLFVVLISLPR
jgi:hypothetical protein